MKKPKWYRRYCFMCCIQQKLLQIDSMGVYKFLGEWGVRNRGRHRRLIEHYNKTRFFWQKNKKVS